MRKTCQGLDHKKYFSVSVFIAAIIFSIIVVDKTFAKEGCPDWATTLDSCKGKVEGKKTKEKPDEKSFSESRFYLGGNILSNKIEGDTNGIDAGFGFGLIMGYGFTPAVAMQLNWDESSHNIPALKNDRHYKFRAVLLSIKNNFLVDRKLQPFLQAGVGGFALILKNAIPGDLEETSGTGFSLGGGADYYITPHFSVGAGVSRRFIKYDKGEARGVSKDIEPKLNGNTTSLNVDFIYHF